jgi:hypothetical protein
MTTTVSTGAALGTAYTWNSYPDVWATTNSAALSWDTAANTNSYTLTVDETATNADALRNAFTKATIAEAFNAVDGKPGWGVGKNAAEAIATTEVFARTVGYSRTLVEAVTVTEAKIGWTIGFKPQEGFQTTDSGQRAVTKRLADALATVDVLLKTPGKRAAEFVTTLDVLRNNVTQGALAEGLHIADAAPKTIGKLVPETVHSIDASVRQTSFHKTLAEAWLTTDTLFKVFSKRMVENYSFVDMWLMKGKVVIADLVLREDALTYSDFLQAVSTGAPANYSSFVPFIPGDYNISVATIKVVMTRENLSQDVRLPLGKVFVDVPDVNDRGRVTITVTSGPTHVVFNRTFVSVPEVGVVGVSASQFGQPRISNQTKDGFDVELINTSNARITGTVSWTAQGY